MRIQYPVRVSLTDETLIVDRDNAEVATTFFGKEDYDAEYERRSADAAFIVECLNERAPLPRASGVPEAEAVAWRDVVGWTDLYEVSNQGDVRSKRSGKILSKNLAGSGYVKADLWSGNTRKQTYVHRLVAQAFLGGDEAEVNHKNGIKTDNRVSNLEWSTRSENVNHGYYSLGHIIRAVTAIHQTTGEKREYPSVCEAVRDGFKSAHIHRSLKRPHTTHKGFRWEYTPLITRTAPSGAKPGDVE